MDVLPICACARSKAASCSIFLVKIHLRSQIDFGRVKMSANSDESDYVESLSEEEISSSREDDDDDFLQQIISASFLCASEDRTEPVLRDSLLLMDKDFYPHGYESGRSSFVFIN